MIKLIPTLRINMPCIHEQGVYKCDECVLFSHVIWYIFYYTMDYYPSKKEYVDWYQEKVFHSYSLMLSHT